MKKTWLVGGLAVLFLAGTAQAQDAVVKGCEKFKADIAKNGEVCAAENAEAAKIACKTKDDLNAAMKIFRTCGSKAVAAATSGGKAGGATASKDDAAAKEGAATREWKCKAVDIADNKDIAESAAPRMSECLTALKEKVKAAKCSTAGTEKVEFLNQSWVINRWSKGTKLSVACK